MADRPDNFKAVNALKNKHEGKVGLIILGGPSGAGWVNLAKRLQPNILLGPNGCSESVGEYLNYWMCIESTGRRMRCFQAPGPQLRLVHWQAYEWLHNKNNAIAVNRDGFEFDNKKKLSEFSVREYGLGFISGSLMKPPAELKMGPLRVGTVALQLIHLGGILGLKEIHTIGYDHRFRGDKHHWYPYPKYQPNKYWDEHMFTTHKGIPTMHFWIQSVEYMQKFRALLPKWDYQWYDHSDGLHQEMGMAQGKPAEVA